ncbi:MAG: hypothetical protein GVY28_10115, partial [Alphaproteobacteria bacterium]|nr:hypothetical protein [Alphaproteobacteria bacterium]
MVVVRRVLIALAVALVLLALVGVAAWRFAAPPLLAGVIETRAAAAGIDLATVTVAEIGADRIVLTDLATRGDGVRIDRATLRFDAGRLLAERVVETVALDGVALALTLGPDGAVAIPGITLPAGDGPPPDRPPTLPLDRIAVTDLDVAAATPVGPLRLDGALTIETTGDG